METGNSTKEILEQDFGSGNIHINDPLEIEDVDECALNSQLCGMEAGCVNTIGSYKCICMHDLKDVSITNRCEKNQPVLSYSTSTENGITEVPKPAPTEGAFHSHQLLKMFYPSKLPPPNGTDVNGTQFQNTTVNSFHSTPGAQAHPTVLLACLLAIALVSMISLVTIMWRRRRRQLPWLPFCLGKDRPHVATAASLGKCMQQYVTNPNYYSSSPDGPLLKSLRDMELPHENIVFLEEIGEGCFGKVHKGIYTTNSGLTLPVAVKILKDGANSEAEVEFEREVEIMSAFCHENILKLLGVVFKDAGTTPWMVFEFMQYGDLAQLLRSNSPCSRRIADQENIILHQRDLIWVATQIANGMVYLSSQHFVHRDLATRNCLVGDNLSVKISDFGMSRVIYTSDYYKIGGSRMLPIRWMAPESITYGKFSLESDVWSYGVVLWEIFTYGKQPYYGHSNDEVVKLILQGILLSPPENCPSFVYSIMAGCWKTEPRDRLTFPEIFSQLAPNSPDRLHHMTQGSLHDDGDMLLDNENYLLPSAVTVL